MGSTMPLCLCGIVARRERSGSGNIMGLVLTTIPFTQIQSWTTGCFSLVPIYEHEQCDADFAYTSV